MGKPNIATREHRNVVILFFMGAVLVLITISPGRTQTVFADTATACDVGVAGEGRFAAGEMSRRLERAWNAGDVQTLAMFADDAHVLTAWGQFWEGKSQLSSFLHSFFYQQTRPLQTLAQCEDGDRVIWTFRYPSGVNSAMIITVQNAQVVNLYWQFLPYDFNAPSESLWVSGSEEAPESAAVEASAIALAGAGLMYLVVLSDRPRRPVRVSGELFSALRARIETDLPDLSPDPPTMPVESLYRHADRREMPVLGPSTRLHLLYSVIRWIAPWAVVLTISTVIAHTADALFIPSGSDQGAISDPARPLHMQVQTLSPVEGNAVLTRVSCPADESSAEHELLITSLQDLQALEEGQCHIQS
jgi:hypothetical protein